MKLRSIAAGIALSIAGVVSASATSITYNFAGTVTSVDPALASGFAVGGTLTGSYTFESTTSANGGSNSTFAVFDALTALQFQIGSYFASSLGQPEIQVDNDPGGGFHDRYAVLSRASQGLTGPSVGGASLDAFSFRLDDSTDTVFSNALTLPTSLALSSFTSTAFFLFFVDDERRLSIVSGNLTALDQTPLPAALPLFASALAAMGVLGLRRRRQESAKATT
jgi:hypothetical protein